MPLCFMVCINPRNTPFIKMMLYDGVVFIEKQMTKTRKKTKVIIINPQKNKKNRKQDH